jgi:hypothetical protein
VPDVKRGRRPVVITNAERSPGEQLRSREIRYVLMMGVRALCLVAAAVLVSAHAPLLWLWIPICLVGMVVVPWLAVILANDGPPRKRRRVATPVQRTGEHQPPALPPGEPPRVIDYED